MKFRRNSTIQKKTSRFSLTSRMERRKNSGKIQKKKRKKKKITRHETGVRSLDDKHLSRSVARPKAEKEKGARYKVVSPAEHSVRGAYGSFFLSFFFSSSSSFARAVPP